MTLLAVRVALAPTPSQDRALRSHAGAARVAFNWGLGRVKANLSQRAAEKSYAIADTDLTPYVDWSSYGLRKAWNAAKAAVAPWWAENSKEAYATGLERLARALKNWSASRRVQRKGAKVGFPRFRSKQKAVPSVRFTTARSGRPAPLRPCRYLARSSCTRTSAPAWPVPASCLQRCGSSAADGSSRSRSSRTFSVLGRPGQAT